MHQYCISAAGMYGTTYKDFFFYLVQSWCVMNLTRVFHRRYIYQAIRLTNTEVFSHLLVANLFSALNGGGGGKRERRVKTRKKIYTLKLEYENDR